MHSGVGSVQQAGAAAAPSKWDGERAVAVALVVLVVAVAGSCHRLRCLRSVFSRSLDVRCFDYVTCKSVGNMGIRVQEQWY